LTFLLYFDKVYYYAKHGKNNRGYHKVELYTLDSKKTTHFIARLVAEAFIENPENKPQVNHKTGDKDKNSSEDLEWTNQSENMFHAYKTGLRTYKKFTVSEETKEKMSKSHIGKEHYVKKVAQINPNTNEIIKIFDSVREAGLSLGCHETSISEVARHKKGRILTKGFKWEFV